MADATTDEDGEIVRCGDMISFTFGIPPTRVECMLYAGDRGLRARVVSPAGVKPSDVSIGTLRRHIGAFCKVGRKHGE